MISLRFREKIPGHWKNQASSGRLRQQNRLLGSNLLDLGTMFLVKLSLGLERTKDMLTKTQKWWLRNLNRIFTFLLLTTWP